MFHRERKKACRFQMLRVTQEGRPAPTRRLPTDMNNDNIAAIELQSPETDHADLWPDEPASDGRVARGQRTRRNVADALGQLLRDGDPDPTAKAIAEQAGVSLRLVFHHFSDMDDLYLYVAVLQLRRQWSDLPRVSRDSPSPPGPIAWCRTAPRCTRRSQPYAAP